ncbi:DA1-like domain-containing protein [Heracleum sosnowskyi]|uniref:DA1-like domain-containing protein n=1 Tax=Heracleum sosnowskyi TaxID=360622 RepID=A0AAD8H1I9_9APIA|nr:DA1-like domain-containing protein [Heracleum sosnowskyi]
MEYNGGYMNGGYGAFTFEDPLSEDENEDIHHAVQYSILESNSAEMNFVESSYTEEDEHHPGSTQGSTEHSDESMRQNESSTSARDSNCQIDQLWDSNSQIDKVWDVCRESSTLERDSDCQIDEVWDSNRQINQVWDVCRGSSTSERDSNCHIGQVCDVCDEVILSDRLTRIYWGQKACDKHLSDGSTKCCSCSRLKIGNMRFISLNDGRKLCSDCHCTAIMDTEACIPLFHEVYRFLEGIDMKILKDIPIFLVDEKDMNKISSKLSVKDKRGTTLGMTTLRAEFVVRSVARSYQRGENIYVKKEVQNIRRIHEVTSMMILYGYPRLVIGATIAHEMIHAWIGIEGYKKLRLEVEEGICEVMSHKWLDWYAFVGDDFLHTTPEQAEFLRNLKEVTKNKKEVRYDKIYGHGFREAKWAIERYGLRLTISYAARTGKFPK